MKQFNRSTICLLLLATLGLSFLSGCGGKQVDDTRVMSEKVQETSVPEPEIEPSPTPTPTPTPPLMMLTQEQRDSVCLLNYITVLTQEINSSKNSRLFLEEAYTYLVNNLNLNAIDKRTQMQILSLLDLMEGYQMIDVKRERLAYIYEQNKAQSLRAAIPNPLALLSAAQSYRPGKLALSVIYMAVDSATSYKSNNRESELAYLKDGWALDDEEAEQIHNSRKGLFSYAVNMVRENDIPSDLVLTEQAVAEFVRWKNNDNIMGRIRFLEKNVETYQAYGGYWLVLAETYYRADEYTKCLSAIQKYQDMQTRIFRNDYELARVLPFAIEAASEVLDINAYEITAVRFARLIQENTDNKDWDLRYYAAQTFVDLYAKTNNISYIKDAFELALNNVNDIVGEQYALNDAYLRPLVKVKIPQGATKDEKKKIEQYNDTLKDNRKTELPPVYEPLLVNCDLLFALAEELNINGSQREEISRILRNTPEDQLFLCLPLNHHFDMDNEAEIDASQYDISCVVFGKDASLFLPAFLLSDGAIVNAWVKSGRETFVAKEWKVLEVDRDNSEDLQKFRAQFAFSLDDKVKFAVGDTVKISIRYPGSDQNREQLEFTLTASGKFLGAMVFE